MNERVNTPISTAELERRWALIRAEMAAQKIDVLLAQGNNDFMGGYVKYLTDLPATNGYPFTVVFPREDLMTVVGQGAFGQDLRLSAADAHATPAHQSPHSRPHRAAPRSAQRLPDDRTCRVPLRSLPQGVPA